MTDRTSFYSGLTEFYRYENDGGNNINPQYNNQPLRWFSFGINHRFNFSKPDEEQEVVAQRFSLQEEQVKKIAKEINKSYEASYTAQPGVTDQYELLHTCTKAVSYTHLTLPTKRIV